MEFVSPGDDDVAMALARKAYALHTGLTAALGATEPDDVQHISISVRRTVLEMWERAGSPPGSLRRAAILGAELVGLVADNPAASPLQDEGVTPEQDVTFARQGADLLVELASEFDQPHLSR